jgi:hypothetical protein
MSFSHASTKRTINSASNYAKTSSPTEAPFANTFKPTDKLKPKTVDLVEQKLLFIFLLF